MKTGAVIRYPVPASVALQHLYDFLFTKQNEWFYINSFDDPDAPLVKKQCKTVTDKGEVWVIVAPRTGQVKRAASPIAAAQFKLQITGG